MLFLPYKLDVSLYRIPYLTILACLICVVTFLFQLRSDARFTDHLQTYCARDLDANLRAMLASTSDATLGLGCESLFMTLRESKDRDAMFSRFAGDVHNLDFYRDKAADLKYKEDSLRSAYAEFESLVPRELTDKLAYRPDGYNVIAMVTSTFAHSSWDHLLGNLFFFFIFAACVESVLGPMQFFISFMVMTFATSLAYSHSSDPGDALPTIGLSGVVMGMMVLLTTLLPQARIWCFFWFLLIVRRFTLPVLVIVAWYVGWNIYDLYHHDASSRINYMAHVSGAITGFALGLLYRFFSPGRLNEAMVQVGTGG